MMKQVQKGFTLIELMIVVAIIGILASIGIPAYSDYTARTKVTTGLAELAGYKTAAELVLNEGGAVTLAAINMPASTTNCTFAASDTQLGCTLLNAPSQISGGAINLDRSAAGAWTCSVNTKVAAKYKPKGC